MAANPSDLRAATWLWQGVVKGKENRRSYNGLRTSALHSAILRVATFIGRATAGKTVIRIYSAFRQVLENVTSSVTGN